MPATKASHRFPKTVCAGTAIFSFLQPKATATYPQHNVPEPMEVWKPHTAIDIPLCRKILQVQPPCSPICFWFSERNMLHGSAKQMQSFLSTH
jgi:hypothetical protein